MGKFNYNELRIEFIQPIERKSYLRLTYWMDLNMILEEIKISEPLSSTLSEKISGIEKMVEKYG